ncbi:MAG: 16S rRNA processing protein RimM [Bacteroidetes bacterium]|nr:16S rRNA processing protein RimM [Bacteroidota bacterium]
MSDWIEIGRTKKVRGVQGELRVQIEREYLEEFFNSEVVFLNLRGRHTPFFIENIRYTNHLLVKFEEVNSREAALPYASKMLSIREEDLLDDKKEAREQLFSSKYIGYDIHDEQSGLVGTIQEVIEMPQQEMAIVSYNSRDILIPMNELLIKKVEKKKKVLLMDLPRGLLEL